MTDTDIENQQALRFFLNSEALSSMGILDDIPTVEAEDLQSELSHMNEQQLMDCLRLSHQVLISENSRLTEINQQVQNKTSVRTDVSLALMIADTLNAIKENPEAVAMLVISARVLAANKLKVGKNLEYQGSSVFADLLSLLKLTINKKP